MAAEALGLDELVWFSELHAARLGDHPQAALLVPAAVPSPIPAAVPSPAPAAVPAAVPAAYLPPAVAAAAAGTATFEAAPEAAASEAAASEASVVALHYNAVQRARNLGVGGVDDRIEKLRKLNNWVKEERPGRVLPARY